MTVNIVVFMTVGEEHVKSMSSLFDQLTFETMKEDGCSRFEVYQAAEKHNLFVLVERWKDQSAIDWHMKQLYTKNFIELSKGKILKTEVTRMQL